MRVYVDGFVYSYQRFGGINRYIEEQVLRWPESVDVLLSVPENVLLPGSISTRVERLDINHYRFKPGRVASVYERVRQQRVVDRWNADVVHPSYYKSLLLELRARRSQVLIVTIHDFIHRLFPQHAGVHNHSVEQDALIQRADALICISENTRTDLLRLYPALKKPIFVITCAVGSEYCPSGHGWQPTQSPEFLFVGGRSGYKNFKVALKALGEIKKSRKEWRLTVIGPRESDEELAMIESLGLTENVFFAGALSDDDLVAAYRRCCALIYPSLYEGFGIPPLEAIRCGTVVVACNCSSIPEVVGEAGLLVPPGDCHLLAEALVAVMENTTFRSELVERGKRQASLFSWERSAGLTLEAYKSVLS